MERRARDLASSRKMKRSTCRACNPFGRSHQRSLNDSSTVPQRSLDLRVRGRAAERYGRCARALHTRQTRLWTAAVLV